jgi:hypothetical protein
VNTFLAERCEEKYSGKLTTAKVSAAGVVSAVPPGNCLGVSREDHDNGHWRDHDHGRKHDDHDDHGHEHHD